jgi:hypothetical protein
VWRLVEPMMVEGGDRKQRLERLFLICAEIDVAGEMRAGARATFD